MHSIDRPVNPDPPCCRSAIRGLATVARWAEASDIVERTRELGLEVRAGVHTGEIDRSSDDISGIAVHIAARVESAAAPSTVWVTGTVRELVIGSGIEFVSRGERDLKGVPGRCNLYEVAVVA